MINSESLSGVRRKYNPRLKLSKCQLKFQNRRLVFLPCNKIATKRVTVSHHKYKPPNRLLRPLILARTCICLSRRKFVRQSKKKMGD